MNEVKKEWYKTWWGIILIVLFWGFLIPIIIFSNLKTNLWGKLTLFVSYILSFWLISKNPLWYFIFLIVSAAIITMLYTGQDIFRTKKYASPEEIRKKDEEIEQLKAAYEKKTYTENQILEMEEKKKQLEVDIDTLSEEYVQQKLVGNTIRILEELEYKKHRLEEEIKFLEEESRTSDLINTTLENEIRLRNKNISSFKSSEESKILHLANANNLISAISNLEKKQLNQIKKLEKMKNYYDALKYAVDQYFIFIPESFNIKAQNYNEISDLVPNVMLHLKHMDIKDLNKAFNTNYKQIDETLTNITSRYNNKTNQTIYKLMVIAMKSELQNILYNLKYDKLENAISEIKKITTKYLQITTEGNQSISGTMAQFIGVIEYLFINAAKIEYNYYVKREQIKQEQIVIRQQIKEEAEERKALQREKEKIEQEENKYHQEIEKINMLINESQDNEETENLKRKILELQSQLSNVIVEKEKITNLQNGKAGNIYIISNLGSFGDKIFKIGMTRRLDPQERINELGSASVPFKFDVHSFIFSDDAVSLEKKLHNMLNNQRVNKVNSRKEFFNTTVYELEKLINEIEPTASFNKTMLAEEYNQSLSTTENFDTIYSPEMSEEDIDEIEEFENL